MQNLLAIKKREGFTLIELLIVIAIIGVLATFLMANFVGVRQRARDAQRKSDLRQIQSALELYRADNSAYPDDTLMLTDCDTEFSDGSSVYMKSIPCDPLSTDDNKINYTYDNDGSGGYSIIACLENEQDNQKDTTPPDPNPCSAGQYSFTLHNP